MGSTAWVIEAFLLGAKIPFGLIVERAQANRSGLTSSIYNEGVRVMARRRRLLSWVLLQHYFQAFEFLAGYAEVFQEVNKGNQESG
jgi:hypothetical protein